VKEINSLKKLSENDECYNLCSSLNRNSIYEQTKTSGIMKMCTSGQRPAYQIGDPMFNEACSDLFKSEYHLKL
jgi:hypothetical protein